MFSVALMFSVYYARYYEAFSACLYTRCVDENEDFLGSCLKRVFVCKSQLGKFCISFHVFCLKLDVDRCQRLKNRSVAKRQSFHFQLFIYINYVSEINQSKPERSADPPVDDSFFLEAAKTTPDSLRLCPLRVMFFTQPINAQWGLFGRQNISSLDPIPLI